MRWPNGRSQLTDLGIKQSRNLGRLLRNRYGDWITYLHSKKNHVLLRASAAQRCIDTLRHVASETFPSSSEYAIYSLPKPIDSVLWEEPYCPEADEEEKQNMLKSDVLEYENLPQIKVSSTTFAIGVDYSPCRLLVGTVRVRGGEDWSASHDGGRNQGVRLCTLR